MEKYFMRQALCVARTALDIGEVPVGCIVPYMASHSVIVSHGANQVNATRDATRHAEIVAIDRMLTKGRSSDQLKLPPEIFANCDLYVTCEPCIMCAAALSVMGIGRVFFGCRNDRFGGCGSILHLHKEDTLQSSKHHGFTIHGGLLEEEAVALLRSFYDRENFHAPDHKRKRKSAEEETK
ncbi:hypothetical protein THAPSDRAFT_268551 [Thalassiosira pseudonana CCMP1335]|uniref:CMP/dCMP-type deaminase domain-containing protein n=1 Tax=Thalassiosira pseudonana TaxID=35128 RepID=B8BW62_THAPS|nr:hypothetical protein THAPSDRAFT_268551 [Thalassiosira pseudonana CCMP1335]EED93975.1 hypothetical protein THAPSDRAFT_268551 [Thalassiosira pseudonana CCMP1335]